LPFSHAATSLAAADVWNLICAEVEVIVADLADVIRSKESAGRAKDLHVLSLLYRHQATRRSGTTD
jgi:hypothetical protein